jgi:serine protease Do
MNIDGQLAAVAISSSQALSMADVAPDIQDLLARVNDERATGNGDAEENDKGWIGIMHAPVNPDYARKYNLPRGGIRINQVIPGSPADKAGLKAGDLIVRVNGKEMRFSGKEAASYFGKVLRAREGRPFTLVVMRDQERKVLTGVFGEPPKPDNLRVKDLGVVVQEIDPSLVARETLVSDEGVYVNDIEKGSPAAMGGGNGLLSKGDVITAIAGKPTPDLAAFSAAIEKIRKEQPPVVLVAYNRGRVTGYAALNLDLGEKQ